MSWLGIRGVAKRILLASALGMCAVLLGRLWVVGPPRPSLRLSTGIITFEGLPPGVEGCRPVWITNAGRAPLLIERVKASCGCARIEMDRWTVPPGESAKLEVCVEGQPFGRRADHILIFSNDPKRPVVRVDLRQGTASWRVEPTPLDFGQIERSALPKTVEVRIVPPSGWDPRQSRGACRVTVDSAVLRVGRLRLQETRMIAVPLTVLPTAPSGELFAMLHVLCPGGFGQRVPVFGYVRGALYAVPSSLVVGPTWRDGPDIEEDIRIECRKGRFEIQRVQVELLDADLVRITAQPEDGSEGRLVRVRVTPADGRGWSRSQEVRGKLVLQCAVNGASTESLAVPIRVLLLGSGPTSEPDNSSASKPEH